jgi:demethylmenaquinone methyltransferase / 2-methoxy-6-polyprenyl-1,4-benzoquinol methylase
MFDQVAARYDARNRLFSADRDHAWRRYAARRAALRPGQTALDLCTGTGRLAHELLPFVGPSGRVVGIDFSPAMLELARAREPEVEFRLADVTRLREADASVDAITIGFGLRNLVDRGAALREMFRVLRPGGRLVILEFSPPARGPLMRAYRFYLSRVMPTVVGLRNAGEASAYRYLAETVQAFPEPGQLARQLEGLGFTVSVERMTLGIVSLHVAERRG